MFSFLFQEEKEAASEMFQKIANAYEVNPFHPQLSSSNKLEKMLSLVWNNERPRVYSLLQVLKDDEQRKDYDYMLDNPGW